jgi:hypothetical protein
MGVGGCNRVLKFVGSMVNCLGGQGESDGDVWLFPDPGGHGAFDLSVDEEKAIFGNPIFLNFGKHWRNQAL